MSLFRAQPRRSAGVLDDLLSSADAAAKPKAVSGGVAARLQGDHARVVKRAAAERRAQFTERIAEELAAFKRDSGRTRLDFEPMEDLLRLIVLQMVDEQELVGRTEGTELADRHVVVFKPGEEAEFDAGAGADEILEEFQSTGRRPSSRYFDDPAGSFQRPLGLSSTTARTRKRKVEHAAEQGPQDLAVLNTVKRDLRTIEEIQRDMAAARAESKSKNERERSTDPVTCAAAEEPATKKQRSAL